MFIHCNIPSFIEFDTTIIHNKRWYVSPVGTFPSVTTVLGYQPKPGIEDWKQSMGIVAATDEMERCATRGTAVHLMAERYLNNDALVTDDQQPSNIKLFNKLRIALNRIDNIRIQEVPLCSQQLKLAGRVDCVAEFDGVLSIIDFKTSNSTKDPSIIEDYFLQCTAYAIMYSEMFNEAIEDIVVIIACEKFGPPLVFKRKIEPYIAKLLYRIADFYQGIKLC